jgi:hypothetical protein
MNFEIFFFWITLVMVFELFVLKTAAYLLALLLAFLTTLVSFLFFIEFDVLASLIFGVYSSVFIVFFLLLLHFTTFWASAVRKHQVSMRYTYVYFLVVAVFCLFMLSGIGAQRLTVN